MTETAVTLTDSANRVVFSGDIEGDLSGLPTGWTEDNADPANVTSNDGALDLGDGGLNVGGTVVVASTFFANPATSELSFYGADPTTKPAIANATAADIIAALVTLGLVTDAT